MSGTNQGLYDRVTGTILEALKSGEAEKVPWRKPWHGGWVPRNGLTQRPYSGINVIYLQCIAHLEKWNSQEWFTYNGARRAGGHVRKGEKSKAVVVYYDRAIKKTGEVDPSTSAEMVETYPVIKFYYVFNREQCDEIPEVPRTELSEDQKWDQCEKFVQDTGADIHEDQARACYIPSTDIIQMPSYKSFLAVEGWYSTLFHELIHWTGQPDRQARDLTGSFGSQNYAAEELVAEFGSAYLNGWFQIEGDVQHPEYINNWCSLLSDNNRAIFKATSEAKKATDWILQKTGLLEIDVPEESIEAESVN